MRVLVATALLVPLLAGGCAGIQRIVPDSVSASLAAPEPSPGREIVGYLGRLRTLGESGLEKEAVRQRQAAAATPTDLQRLKSALALEAAGHGDEGDILAIVDPLAKSSRTDPEVRAMASFLHGIALERRRLKESAAASGARLKDERRAREAERQRADALQERAAQLQQKLDALMDLEKSLSGRQGQNR